MEALRILKLPLEAAKFAGRQLLGGAWAELPPLPQPDFKRPVRASIQYFSTFEIPENIELGEE
jgi:hypothetical protein